MYKYTTASMISKGGKLNNPKDDYINLFQETLTEQFYNTSDWWTIQEESVIGSKIFIDVDVHITHLINAETGLKLGDDWKTLLFPKIDHLIEIGKIYSFDNNIWLTVNTEIIKNLTGTCTVRRCNNTVRWIDESTGAYYEEPCAIEYLVKEPRDYATAGTPFMTPGGFLKMYLQINNITNKIKQNQRFLFGNSGHWTCYKVIGTGINDFRNLETYNNNSAKVLVLDLTANFVNDELDDIVNGIADVNTNLYSITLDKTTADGAPLSTVKLTPSILYNGDSATRPVTWLSSDTTIATVDINGLVTLKKVGTCTITATIENNPAYAVCSIVVTATPTDNIVVMITPSKNYILEGSQRSYSVYLYKNDVQQVDTFTITCNPNTVVSSSYIFQQTTGNSFLISNVVRDVSSYLTVTCVSGTHSKSFDIFLRGAWLNGNA